jgi:uncharacterized membrane protein
MADRPVFVFVGVYDSKEGAEADYEIVKELHESGAVGGFDAAVITKDQQGKVRVNKDETATRRGGWTGLGVGALVGILFPPSLIAGAAVGAGVGALTGNLARGMSRGDMKDLGEALDEGDAALVVVGESKIKEAIAKEAKRANRMIEKEIDADAEDARKQMDAAVDEALTTAK